MRALLKNKENDVYNVVCEVVNDALTAGGGTRDIDTGKKDNHKTGYYVGISNIYTGKVSKLNFWEASYKTVHCAEPLVGSWVDEDGEMYVDATRWVEQKETAIQIAKTYHQKVIWDIKNNTEIRVK